jgi:hypothetical protein
MLPRHLQKATGQISADQSPAHRDRGLKRSRRSSFKKAATESGANGRRSLCHARSLKTRATRQKVCKSGGSET